MKAGLQLSLSVRVFGFAGIVEAVILLPINYLGSQLSFSISNVNDGSKCSREEKGFYNRNRKDHLESIGKKWHAMVWYTCQICMELCNNEGKRRNIKPNT
ncbi:hypothetical protein PRUPE_2G018200 [Prunus persica]|uniref:Uncharacterized protein n=1 Tax=Prunus persica TaxID=3760 RepID=A0A251Q9L7_PRUPE|nr:hypothetical protein PRUPE_2G018200 [Prunus persica]